MKRPIIPPFRQGEYHPVVALERPVEVFDLTQSYDPAQIASAGWGIGRYDEARSQQMYNSDLYTDGRHIHMGIDIWGPEGTKVFSFKDGRIYAQQNNAGPRNYGPTIVIEYDIEGTAIWVLYGHLTRDSLSMRGVGETVRKGDLIGYFGSEDVNGGWAPHLHFQLSLVPPLGADLPGVVHPKDRDEACRLYPDPRLVLGALY